MRENYRNSIVSVKKFPQFTTTNVIEGHVSAINIEIGQAGIVAIFSLIFYYITLDNILNIIVLLILAGISIGAITGNNSIINQAIKSKDETEIAEEKEMLDKCVAYAIEKNKYGALNLEDLEGELQTYTKGGAIIDGTESIEAYEDGKLITTKKIRVKFIKTEHVYMIDQEGSVEDYYLADTVWQNNVNYVLDEQNKTLTISQNDTSRNDIYNGDVIIKKKAVINGVEYTTKFPDYCLNLFAQASRMTSFSMEDIGTSNVRSMSGMFAVCTALEDVDLSNMDTSNVTDMQQLFYNCSAIKNLDLTSFDIRSVYNMALMFEGVTAKLDLSGWNIPRDGIICSQSGAVIFGNNLSEEIVAKNWNVSKAQCLVGLFANCSSLKKIDISNWTFGTGHIAHGFLAGCSSLTTVTGIDGWSLSSFNLNQSPFAGICQNCTAINNRLTGGIWNNGTWSNGTFTPST